MSLSPPRATNLRMFACFWWFTTCSCFAGGRASFKLADVGGYTGIPKLSAHPMGAPNCEPSLSGRITMEYRSSSPSYGTACDQRILETESRTSRSPGSVCTRNGRPSQQLGSMSKKRLLAKLMLHTGPMTPPVRVTLSMCCSRPDLDSRG